MAANFCAKAAITPSMSIARRKRFPPSRAIVKSSNSPRKEFARIWPSRALEFASMTKTAEKTVVRSIHQKREQITTLREELEDLNDYLDLTEARVRDEGKPRLTHAEVKKRYGIK